MTPPHHPLDLSLTALRVLREVAERGSFTAAATATGYTQSAVSRQAAALETAVGRPLFERFHQGVRLTDAGRTLLRRATRALDELAAAERELDGEPPARAVVRLGAFTSAGAWLVPRVSAALRDHPDVDLLIRTGSTRSLVRALRAGSLDLAVLARTPPFRAPDDELPPLHTITILDDELLVAVPPSHPLAAADSVTIDELAEQSWVAGRTSGDDSGLGVWPGLARRPRVVHSTPDWLAKLQLVAAGAGITTVPPLLLPVLPPGIRVLRVSDGPRERRQVLLARVPGTGQVGDTAVRAVEIALRDAAAHLPAAALRPAASPGAAAAAGRRGSGTTSAPRPWSPDPPASRA
jgi:DNA-binding transcriptional LysR family regulator